jgi:uncharacterized protein (TIRG00374 family)
MVSFARLQRRLLRAGSIELATGTMLAVTYAGNAISVSLPLAGSTMGSAYAYRAFRRFGADASLAGWSLAVSGLVSTLMFSLILVGGALSSGNSSAAVAGGLSGIVLVLPIALLVVASRWEPLRSRGLRSARWVLSRSQQFIRRPSGDIDALLADTVEHLGALRLTRSSWLWVMWLSAWNWLADIACLAFSIAALGARVPWTGLVLAWGAGAGAASFGLTPGGLGVVEAALAAALVAVGIHATSALGAVLLYRFISLWLVVAVGWSVYGLTGRAIRGGTAS